MDLLKEIEDLAEKKSKINMKKITGEDLDLDYTVLFSNKIASEILKELRDTVEYYEGDLTKVKVFGKWHNIPRQQAAYGDDGLDYTFSGNTIPAKPWTPLLKSIRNLVGAITNRHYNFVLVNRYRNGSDHIGEHRDNEKELDKDTPIVSVSLGQQRMFVLRHRDCRRKDGEKRNVPPVKVDLQHGSLLLMNPPTNEFWYHSVPPRKSAVCERVNLTFRKLNR